SEMNPAEVNDRGLASDGGKITVVAIVEWFDSLCAAQPGFDQTTDIAPLLLRDWSDARKRLAPGIECQCSVSDSEYLRMTRDGEVGIDFNPTDTVAFSSNPMPGRRSGN